jgi:hypothetical protein
MSVLFVALVVIALANTVSLVFAILNYRNR